MTRAHYRLRPDVYDKLARLNISQKRLADRIQISPAYASQLLAGTRFPGPEVRERFLQMLPELSFDQLFESVPR